MLYLGSFNQIVSKVFEHLFSILAQNSCTQTRLFEFKKPGCLSSDLLPWQQG